MKHSQTDEDRRSVLEAALLAAIIIAIAGAAIWSAMQPLSLDSLKADVGDLRTSASAGRLLATQYTDGNVTETFMRNNAELIYSQVKSIRKSLDSADPDPDVVLEHWQARHYALQLEQSMYRMSNDSTGVGIERNKAGELMQQFIDIEQKLKTHPKE